MATTQHYLWASGHFILLVASLRYFLSSVMFRSVSPWWYKASFTGALISYAIVCYKSLGRPQPNLAFVRRALLDENVQYFLLAFFWWTSKPVAVALIPYAIFSLFHALTFTRTTIMPQFLPHSPPVTSDGPPQPHPLAKKMQAWVKANYNTAMRVVAYAELIIFVRVVLGAITFRNSLVCPLIYAQFLRQRWYQSEFTRDGVKYVNLRIDTFVRAPGRPPVLVQIWTQAQSLTQRWTASDVIQPNNAGAAPAGNGPRRG